MNAPRTIGALEIWTVYRNPKDYPGQFVARKSLVTAATRTVMTADMFVADTLAEIHALLPRGLVRIPRYECDDPVIVEVWL